MRRSILFPSLYDKYNIIHSLETGNRKTATLTMSKGKQIHLPAQLKLTNQINIISCLIHNFLKFVFILMMMWPILSFTGAGWHIVLPLDRAKPVVSPCLQSLC